MSLNTAQKIAQLRGLTAKWDSKVAATAPVYPQFCSVVNSKGADEQYAMLGSMPGMREWLGDRQFAQLKASDYVLKNKLWEDSIRIEKTAIDDDRIGMYEMVLEQLAVEAAFHPDSLFFKVLVDGATQACFDGQNFFDTDHVWGDSGTQSNKIDYNAADHNSVTDAEFKAAFHKARRTMLSLKRDNGEPFHRPTVTPVRDFVLIVPLALEEQAVALLKPLINGGETNMVLDMPSVITCTYLTESTKFYLLRTGQPLKPFVFQARQPLKRQMKGLEDQEFKDVKFMCDARYSIGYCAWWNAVEVTFN